MNEHEDKHRKSRRWQYAGIAAIVGVLLGWMMTLIVALAFDRGNDCCCCYQQECQKPVKTEHKATTWLIPRPEKPPPAPMPRVRPDPPKEITTQNPVATVLPSHKLIVTPPIINRLYRECTPNLVAQVPEPMTAALLGIGAVAFLLMRS